MIENPDVDPRSSLIPGLGVDAFQVCTPRVQEGSRTQAQLSNASLKRLLRNSCRPSGTRIYLPPHPGLTTRAMIITPCGLFFRRTQLLSSHWHLFNRSFVIASQAALRLPDTTTQSLL